jgi:hypothetical protein
MKQRDPMKKQNMGASEFASVEQVVASTWRRSCADDRATFVLHVEILAESES